jgi:archaemetzincin
VRSVAIWWIGEGTPDGLLIEGVRRHLEEEYGLPAALELPQERPSGAFDPRRGQHSSSLILAWLVTSRPAGASRLLGVTDADLFIPILTFVFGEAQLRGRAAVVSTARLAGNTVVAPDPKRLLGRLSKECVHELGHTFGLVHCAAPRCVMGRSASLVDVDAKSPHLCPACRVRYRELSTESEGDHE